MSDNLFDIDKLMEQCGGNKTVVQAVLAEFVEQTPKDMASMNKAIEDGDLAQASRVAHSLKGTSGVLGATRLHALCADMEMACRADDAPKVGELLPALKTMAQSCVDFVPELMKMV